MDEALQKALEKDWYIDITTLGRRSGRPHRVEVMLRYVDGHAYLSNQPGAKRDWIANLLADPEFTYHVKQSTRRDLRARVVPVTEPKERERVFRAFLRREGRLSQLQERLAQSHLFLVEFLES